MFKPNAYESNQIKILVFFKCDFMLWVWKSAVTFAWLFNRQKGKFTLCRKAF